MKIIDVARAIELEKKQRNEFPVWATARELLARMPDLNPVDFEATLQELVSGGDIYLGDTINDRYVKIQST